MNLIPSHNCVIQYESRLKTERYGKVQVVLLFPLQVTYQGCLSEVDLKYGNRDITSGSLVFRCSKGNEASGGPLPEFIYTPNLKFTL